MSSTSRTAPRTRWVDLPAVFVEVHRSNMSKRDADGRVLRRAEGKVLKGPGYRPPALDDIVE